MNTTKGNTFVCFSPCFMPLIAVQYFPIKFISINLINYQGEPSSGIHQHTGVKIQCVLFRLLQMQLKIHYYTGSQQIVQLLPQFNNSLSTCSRYCFVCLLSTMTKLGLQAYWELKRGNFSLVKVTCCNISHTTCKVHCINLPIDE